MELGGMRYIPKNHKLITHYIKRLHIPSLEFKMEGNSLQEYFLHAYLRNDRYRQNEWSDLQKADQKLVTAYRVDDELIGMNAGQMINYSAYKILTADYNKEAQDILNKARNQDNYFKEHLKKKKI